MQKSAKEAVNNLKDSAVVLANIGIKSAKEKLKNVDVDKLKDNAKEKFDKLNTAEPKKKLFLLFALSMTIYDSQDNTSTRSASNHSIMHNDFYLVMVL